MSQNVDDPRKICVNKESDYSDYEYDGPKPSRSLLRLWKSCIKEKPCFKNYDCPPLHKCKEDENGIGKACNGFKFWWQFTQHFG